MRLISLSLLGAGLWLATQPASAEQMVPLPINRLAAKAQLILQGKVLSIAVHRDPAGRIYTAVHLGVQDVWKGGLATNRFTIVHAGGVLGDQAAIVSGEAHYAVGEEIVAFLVLNQRGEGVSIGMSQGKFRVWQDPAIGEKLAENRFHGRRSTWANPSGKANPSAGIVDHLTLAELKRRAQGGAD